MNTVLIETPRTAQNRKVAHRRPARGFTLIEMLVVVVIMGLLIGLIGPSVIGNVDKASVTAARADMATLGQALDMYRLDNYRYPTTDQGLEALIAKPSASPEPKNWNPQGYLTGDKVPLDPWEGEYIYLSPGEGGQPYDLFSLGKDGQLGGEGYDQDLSVWD